MTAVFCKYDRDLDGLSIPTQKLIRIRSSEDIRGKNLTIVLFLYHWYKDKNLKIIILIHRQPELFIEE